MPPFDHGQDTPESSTGTPTDNPQAAAGYLEGYQQTSQPGDQQAGGSPDPGQQDVSPSESSTEAGAKPADKDKVPTPLDVAKAAIEDPKLRGGDSPTPKDGQDQQAQDPSKETEAKTGEEGAEGDDKEKPPPFHNHPRWKEMVQKRKELESEVEQLQATYREPAERYQQLNGFLSANNLDAQDFINGLEIMRLMKNDPIQALEALQPYYDALARATGKVLPDDLQQKVDDALIDEDTANTIARERARNQILQQQLARTSEQSEQMRRQQAQSEAERAEQERINGVYNAMVDWEKAWAEKDPDYNLLSPLVRARVSELVMADPPKTTEDAVKLADKAVNEMREHLRKVRPPKQETRTITGGAATGGNQPQPQPKSSLDVARQALAAT